MPSYEIENATVEYDGTSYLFVRDLDAGDDRTRSLANVPDRLVEVTDDVAQHIRTSIARLASYLSPDLEAMKATKATVKFGVKASLKNGKLTSFVSEVGVEGSIEVSVEYTRPAS